MEVLCHLAYCRLVNFVLRYFVDNLVHLDEQLCADSQLVDNFAFHANVVPFMLAKKSTRRANALAVLDANDLQLLLVLFTDQVGWLFSCSVLSLNRWTLGLKQLLGRLSLCNLLLELLNLDFLDFGSHVFVFLLFLLLLLTLLGLLREADQSEVPWEIFSRRFPRTLLTTDRRHS